MPDYCCDIMENLINKKTIVADKDGYYFADNLETFCITLNYCPFCGAKLGGD